jgi:hypothetical protein
MTVDLDKLRAGSPIYDSIRWNWYYNASNTTSTTVTRLVTELGTFTTNKDFYSRAYSRTCGLSQRYMVSLRRRGAGAQSGKMGHIGFHSSNVVVLAIPLTAGEPLLSSSKIFITVPKGSFVFSVCVILGHPKTQES